MRELEGLTAVDLMTDKVPTISADETLRSAAIRLVGDETNALLVNPVAPGRAPGIITTKDLVQVLAEAPSAVLDDILVGEVMSAPAVTVPEFLAASDCIRLMQMTGVRRVFVMDGPRPVGLLNTDDILRGVVGDEASRA